MQFRSQKIKFDGKLTWVPSVVIRDHENASDAKGAKKATIGSEYGIDIFSQSTCRPSMVKPDDFFCSFSVS